MTISYSLWAHFSTCTPPILRWWTAVTALTAGEDRNPHLSPWFPFLPAYERIVFCIHLKILCSPEHFVFTWTFCALGLRMSYFLMSVCSPYFWSYPLKDLLPPFSPLFVFLIFPSFNISFNILIFLPLSVFNLTICISAPSWASGQQQVVDACLCPRLLPVFLTPRKTAIFSRHWISPNCCTVSSCLQLFPPTSCSLSPSPLLLSYLVFTPHLTLIQSGNQMFCFSLHLAWVLYDIWWHRLRPPFTMFFSFGFFSTLLSSDSPLQLFFPTFLW